MNDTDRQSMDDVLASIRRIVRAEKEGAVASASGDEPNGERPDAEGEPLLLTPEMRTDAGAAAEAPAPELAADMSEASAAAEPAVPDREALRDIVRQLLREELAGGAAEDAVRSIIRDELTSGEIGSNISQNVLRTIRAEVARALQAPR